MDKPDKPVKLMFRNLDGEFKELDLTNRAPPEKGDFPSSFPNVTWRFEEPCDLIQAVTYKNCRIKKILDDTDSMLTFTVEYGEKVMGEDNE